MSSRMTNTSTTRKVPIEALDLAYGDRLLDNDGEFEGVVDSVPVIDGARVTYHLYNLHRVTEARSIFSKRRIWIEIERRTS